MKVIIKGKNYTEVRSYSKSDIFKETIQHWVLKYIREDKECGIWKDGKKTASFEQMSEEKDSE